jgi:hypothetical protein
MRHWGNFSHMTFQIPNSKLQIPNKFQYPIPNDHIEFVWNFVFR